MGWESESKRAKRLHRPSLDNWGRDGFEKTFPEFVSHILRQKCIVDHFNPFGKSYQYGSTIPAILDSRLLSIEEFHQRYEARGIPCIIQNIPDCGETTQALMRDVSPDDDEKKENDVYTQSQDVLKSTIMKRWKALDNWTLDKLKRDEDLRHCRLKCGEDDDGYSIRLKLKHFLKYMKYNKDDSPLYIFDSTFDDDEKAKKLLDDFQVPSYFNEDLFSLVGEKRRPPYRWFLVGPQRSGTCVHIDPLGTSAWNTLIAGKKRWVLFPPHIGKHIVKGYDCILKGEDDEAIHYFTTILPRIKLRAQAHGNIGDYKDFECYEFTQHEKETVFIPNGWWHAVLNLTDTIGITQNYCSQRNFDQVWLKTRVGRKKMAYKWLRELKKHYKHLAKRAEDLNLRDGFHMKYDPEEVRKKEGKRAKKHRKKMST